jgi:hypothetical protein
MLPIIKFAGTAICLVGHEDYLQPNRSLAKTVKRCNSALSN